MSDSPPPEALSPGARLGQAREAMGIARAHVAASLHLEEDVLAALEEGREEGLPGPAYVRGYMRSYARLVGLDPEEVVQGLDGAASHRSARPAVGQPPAQPRTFGERAQQHMGLLLGGIVAAMLIAAAAVLWFAWRSADWPFAGAAENPLAAAAASGPANAPPAGLDRVAMGTLSAGPNPDRLAAQRAVALALPVATVAAAEEAPVPGGTQASDLPVFDGERLAPAVPADQGGSLSLVFSDDSWVEVRDAGGVLHAKLGRAGETLALGGEPPFSILLGYAAGVQLRYNGHRVALRPHTQRNVARLVVGH